MRKRILLMIVVVLIIGVIPALAITITDQGTLASWGWTGTPPDQVYDDDFGSWLSICGEPGDIATFEIHYTVTDNSCHLISAGLLIVGQGPVSVYNEPVLSEFTTYHEEPFPESGRIDFAARLLCIIPLVDPDDPEAPLRRIEANYELTAQAPGDGTCPDSRRVTICHVPRRNPQAAHTITINRSALDAHLEHGDTVGACEGN